MRADTLPGAQLVNLSVANNALGGITVQGSSTNNAIYNSAVHGNGGPGLGMSLGLDVQRGNNLGDDVDGNAVDPLFIDPLGNFRLQPASPAVDGGLDTPPGAAVDARSKR